VCAQFRIVLLFPCQCLLSNVQAGEEPTRFHLSLDRVSSELLHSFLASNNLLLLVILLNDSVALLVEDREPRMQMQVHVSLVIFMTNLLIPSLSGTLI